MHYYLFIDYPSLQNFVVEAPDLDEAMEIAEANVWQINNDYLDLDAEYIDIDYEYEIDFDEFLDMSADTPLF